MTSCTARMTGARSAGRASRNARTSGGSGRRRGDRRGDAVDVRLNADFDAPTRVAAAPEGKLVWRDLRAAIGAEGGGFEPPEGRPSMVFKTIAIVRSAIPPE